MEHHFNTSIAQMYGIEEAILLHHFYFWIAKNAANGKHFHDGLFWTYNSKRAYAGFFTYMNETKIFRVIKHLEDEGVIVKGQYNKDKWDKTNWYAITTKGLNLLSDCGYETNVFSLSLQNDIIDSCKMNDGALQNEQSIIISNTDNNTNRNKEKDIIISLKKNDYQAIIDCWNENNGKRLGKVTKITPRRKQAIKKALEDNGIEQETLMALFKALPHADNWLYNPNGSHKNWKPDFDWWMANTNGWLTKALEGKVHKENPQIFSLIMNGEDCEYTPQGFKVWYDEQTKMFWTGEYMYDGRIHDDGYTDENRPDGAKLVLNNARGTIIWNKETKEWKKQ